MVFVQPSSTTGLASFSHDPKNIHIVVKTKKSSLLDKLPNQRLHDKDLIEVIILT